MASSKPLPSTVQVNPATGGKCPICRRSTDAAFRPFCSRRCADVDLSRWLGGGYAIAGRADVDEDGDDTVAATTAQRGPRPDEDDGDGDRDDDDSKT